jgi:hypothetical protein
MKGKMCMKDINVEMLSDNEALINGNYSMVKA